MTLQPLDHGILNIPLSKRGNIDAQLDRYKAEQRKQERAEHRDRMEAFRANRVEAKAKFAELKASGKIKANALKYGHNPREFAQMLDSMAKWEPSKFLKIYPTLAALTTKPKTEPEDSTISELENKAFEKK